MPCDTVVPEAVMSVAIKNLAKSLGEGTVQLKVGVNGALAIVGWKNRDGVADVCAIRKLMTSGSWEFRQALAKAEAVAGRKMNLSAVGSGIHSHDEGASWHPGH